MATEVEIEYARQLRGRAPGFDRIRFMSSGTEAVMAALKAARAFTGRQKIAKIEGTYHGAFFSLVAARGESAQRSAWSVSCYC